MQGLNGFARMSRFSGIRSANRQLCQCHTGDAVLVNGLCKCVGDRPASPLIGGRPNPAWPYSSVATGVVGVGNAMASQMMIDTGADNPSIITNTGNKLLTFVTDHKWLIGGVAAAGLYYATKSKKRGRK